MYPDRKGRPLLNWATRNGFFKRSQTLVEYANSGCSPPLCSLTMPNCWECFQNTAMKLINYFASATFFSVSSMWIPLFPLRMHLDLSFRHSLKIQIWCKKQVTLPSHIVPRQEKSIGTVQLCLFLMSRIKWYLITHGDGWQLLSFLTHTSQSQRKSCGCPLPQFLWIDFVCFICKCLFAICISYNMHM